VIYHFCIISIIHFELWNIAITPCEISTCTKTHPPNRVLNNPLNTTKSLKSFPSRDVTIQQPMKFSNIPTWVLRHNPLTMATGMWYHNPVTMAATNLSKQSLTSRQIHVRMETGNYCNWLRFLIVKRIQLTRWRPAPLTEISHGFRHFSQKNTGSTAAFHFPLVSLPN